MLTPLAELIDGEEQTFVARVTRKPTLTRRGRLSILRAHLRDDAQGAIAAVWFNQAWLVDRPFPKSINGIFSWSNHAPRFRVQCSESGF